MKKIVILILSIFIITNVQIQAQAAKDPIASIKKMVGFIRYKKNQNALASIDTKTFSQNILKEDFDKLTPEQKEKFEEVVKNYIVSKSFPIAFKYFDKIDINYEKPIIKGKNAEVPASILHNGSEKIKFSWLMVEKDGNYLVTDFLSEGKLASETNGSKIRPILKDKGFDELIKKMENASK